jgi:hypothetical protein
MSWPATKVVAAAYKTGLALVIETPHGVGKGVRSSDNWVYFIVAGEKSLVFCEKCDEREYAPRPPGAAPPGEPPNPLVAPGTDSHALFILTWLHKFQAEHQHVEPEEDEAATG